MSEKNKAFIAKTIITMCLAGCVFLILLTLYSISQKENERKYSTTPQPTQTPYIIHSTIRVTTTKYIIVQKLITPVPTIKPTAISAVVPTYTPTPQPSPTKVITEYFTNDNPLCSLNIRNEPSLLGEIVGKIPQNTIVQVIDAVEGEQVRGSNLWCLVKANIIYSGKAYVWCKGLKPINKDLLR